MAARRDHSMSDGLPVQWDLEVDLVCVGAGIGGLAAAITAHVAGSSAGVLESSDKLGGVTAWSFGEVWVANNHLARRLGIQDSTESGIQYLKWLGMGYAEEARIRNQVENAALALQFFETHAGLRCTVIRDFADYYSNIDDGLPEGRYLEVLPFPGKLLGEWQSETRCSPYVPYGMTHEDISGRAALPIFSIGISRR